MRLLYILFLFSLLFIFACTPKSSSFQQFLGQQPSKVFDLLIFNGQVIDGTGKAAFKADVLVAGDSIVYVGEVDTALVQVRKIINASGKIVSPGFIDTHAHGEPRGKNGFRNFLAMGATTVTLGNDGSSPDNLQEWMQKVEDHKPDVNVALFVGHGTIRIASGIQYDSLPSQQQLERMGQLLREQLEAGAIGLSTGLEYLPGLYAPAYELEYLAKVVGEKGKLITSHIRNEDDNAVEASIKELFLQGKHCSVHVSHLKVVYGSGEQRAEEILALLERARKEGVKVTADVYPYTASFTGISLLFPDWALPPHNYEQVVKTRRKELATYLRERVNKRNGPEATLIGTAPFAGKTLAQLAQEKNKPFEDVLIDDIKPGRASAAYFVMDEDLQSRLIIDSTTMISSDGGPEMRHPRGYGSFSKIIEEYVVQKNLLPLEQAVYKMTWLPAKTLGLTDRGRVAVAMKADLLIFDPKEVKTTATYENPFQLARGFDFIFINGKAAAEAGKYAPERSGRVLRKI
ncbi:N-acyl-D-amino-acid deacylase family protein [Rufibacter roseus]|uniref:Amidohydrolase family protein n=1 Tax=Rufibacter roseus TaxID=1567108 RepID=A0ABW2DN67_9BACT|nr:amidohydrolase family protein [Rufibacter roseus]